MPSVQFVTREEDLILPSNGLVVEDQKPEDYVRGASKLKMPVLRPDGQHDDYLPTVEIQRLRDGEGEDTFWCVSCSRNNCLEITHKEKYGYEINMDDQFLAIGSGTQRGVGNGVARVAEWGRLNGFIKEKNRIRFAKNLDEVYVPITQQERNEGLKSLEVYVVNYQWLERKPGSAVASVEEMIDALKYTPIQASVDGSAYSFNGGETIGAFRNYTHEIVVFGYEFNKFWKIFDSETKQALKFAWDYPLGYPMVHSITKKTMKLYRKVNQQAIGSLDEETNQIYLWKDGKIPGGSLFKMLGFTYNLAEVVNEWPAPIAGYFTTEGLQANGEIKLASVEEYEASQPKPFLPVEQKLWMKFLAVFAYHGVSAVLPLVLTIMEQNPSYLLMVPVIKAVWQTVEKYLSGQGLLGGGNGQSNNVWH